RTAGAKDDREAGRSAKRPAVAAGDPDPLRGTGEGQTVKGESRDGHGGTMVVACGGSAAQGGAEPVFFPRLAAPCAVVPAAHGTGAETVRRPSARKPGRMAARRRDRDRRGACAVVGGGRPRAEP